jgi:hypothetical protein
MVQGLWGTRVQDRELNLISSDKDKPYGTTLERDKSAQDENNLIIRSCRPKSRGRLSLSLLNQCVSVFGFVYTYVR